MKLFKSIFILIFLGFILFIVGCSFIKNPEFISVEKLELVEDKTDKLILASDISIFNPNWFTISTKDVTFNLYIDTLYIGNGNIDGGLILPKLDTAIISSSLNIQKSQLNSFINLKDSVSVYILGSTAIPYISKRYYFDFNYKININNFINLFANELIQDVDIQISEVKIKKIDIKNINLEVVFILDNKSEIEYEIKTFDVKVYKSSSYKDIVGSSKIKDSFIVLADTLNEFKSQVKLNTLKMGAAYFSNTMSNKNSFFIEASSKVEYNNIEIPITIKRKIDYNPLTLEIELK